jgi:hypothetical protein
MKNLKLKLKLKEEFKIKNLCGIQIFKLLYVNSEGKETPAGFLDSAKKK